MSEGKTGTINGITWGDFVRLSEPHGVRLRNTEAPLLGHPDIQGVYLMREVGDNVMFCRCPAPFDPSARMGVWVFESVCRRLQLPINFTGWAIIL